MRKLKLNYFTRGEWTLWLLSAVLILGSFLIFDRGNFLRAAASLIGVTSLIFNAKGNPAGQVLMVIFSVLYGIISYSFNYYGEMITYMGMTAPMAAFSFVSWIRNPYEGNKSEVRVNRISWLEIAFMTVLTGTVTAVFYFILKYFNTSNLFFSTVSVATSFAAVYLTFRRSALYAVFYAANDVVLIILWVLAAAYSTAYISVVICFAIFLVNDIYGFISWSKMKKRQSVHLVKK